MRTPHFATFDTLHRLPEAKQIAERMGLRSIKRNGICTQCHYTEQNQGGRVRIVAGVSCESCHGGAADWVAVHADYGGESATKAAESAEHREQRLKESIASGMNNPHNIYLIARQCFDCHTVPHESVVNSGGHLAGSQDFELVTWSQGIVRHNFLRTGGTINGALSPAELRVMFVVGVLTDLEYSLRAVAAATQKATFGTTNAQRAARMKQRLHEDSKTDQRPAAAACDRCRGSRGIAAQQQGGNRSGCRRRGQSSIRFRRTGRRQPALRARPAHPATSSIQELTSLVRESIFHHRVHGEHRACPEHREQAATTSPSSSVFQLTIGELSFLVLRALCALCGSSLCLNWK